MTQIFIKAETIAIAKRKFLKKYPKKKVIDVTRTFVTKLTPKNKRVYRVTGLNKGRKKW